jgi:hypothetical protein
MWNSFWISALFSILYVVLIQFFPLKAVPWIILLGGVASVIFGILVLILYSCFNVNNLNYMKNGNRKYCA